uniref:Leucyl/phenylalanyl-tRNA--protein transferase n=1 Tax=Magnetococcus massalia (strain MO-1) TaxID=451514 RepID=A0A1S7LL38_MAGMO|nr:Leucyl/phenylalanyl-tRNA--protein transferase [Candidatus Magnetococcus massalia]
MPVYRLSPDDYRFPPAEGADHHGIVAVGGDLHPERLLEAYAGGIFPWYSDGEPILWWSLDPRLILRPAEIHIPRSLKKVLRQGRFEITFDHAFDEVMTNCGKVREETDGTWITDEMKDAYGALHRLGYAHSCEAWSKDGEGNRVLAGGIYGVAIGGAFYGESMFFLQPNASKVALASLVHQLEHMGFCIMDCQMTTEHMMRFGAKEISRIMFLENLQRAILYPIPPRSWAEMKPLPW